MADDEQFSLCWNNFNTNLSAGFHESLCRGDLVDVTLAAEGQFVKAHRLVLSVCSPLFREMFTQMPPNQHAFIFLKDVSHSALKDLIQFMYCGEVNVKQEALPAFISTAESLQIKGLTDTDPPPAQTPPEPATPTPQIPQLSSPRVRQQRTSIPRSYKIETIDNSGDEKSTTQIVIQTAGPQTTIPQQTTTQHYASQPQHSQLPTQQISVNTGTTTTTVAQKRPAQRILSSSHVKRTKSTIDPLETSTSTAEHSTAQATQQITVQTAVVSEPKSSHQNTEAEYIDLQMEIPTKSEPDYTEEEVGDVDHEGTTYVEDDSYGELRYDESYFTENEDAGAPAANTATSISQSSAVSVGSTSATSSKAIVKQQIASFSDSSYVDSAEQNTTDAQAIDGNKPLLFIETPWSTPCLVLNNYMYNCHSRKNNKEYWRCHNYSKKIQSERCRSRCVLENGKLKTMSGASHNHLPHTDKIEKIMVRNRAAQLHFQGFKEYYRNDGEHLEQFAMQRNLTPPTIKFKTERRSSVKGVKSSNHSLQAMEIFKMEDVNIDDDVDVEVDVDEGVGQAVDDGESLLELPQDTTVMMHQSILLLNEDDV